MLVRDLTDGQQLDQVLLVRAAETRTKKDGGTFLKLTIGDRTGAFAVNVWDDVEAHAALCVAGRPVHVRGVFEVHPKWGAQARARFAPAEPGTYDEADLHDGPPRGPEAMEADLRELLATVQDTHLRRLLDRVLGEDAPTWPAYRDAPAAKHYHQAYAHGLLEHSLGVAQSVSAISATFPGIDRDVAVTGALLHDIGKLEAYAQDGGAIDLTDAGRLLGEIPLGYYRIRREIEDLDGFPPATAQAVLHIILSHHGALEHGSPVVPATREATLVHMLDNLGGRLGSFDRLEKQLAPGAVWSTFDRALNGGAFFGPATTDADVERAAA
ncbi:MAG TPA: HD domain-containing protein [Solirubrobacteraceae bacterium]|nr:HD domain-containing protein [Solirubrobacteraceae bacterium]